MRTIILLLAMLFTFCVSAADLVVLSDRNTIVMDQVFDDTPVAKVAVTAAEKSAALTPDEPLYLVMNSPGGSIGAGLELIQNLKSLGREVKTITVFSASMGFHTVQGLGERLIFRFGTLMSHKARGGFAGEFPGQLDSRYAFYLKRINEMDKITVERTKKIHTMESYRALIENEYWCDGPECLKQGFADKVVDVRCDATLTGEKEEVLNFNFMGTTITLTLKYAKCPIVTGILGYTVTYDGFYNMNDYGYRTAATKPEDFDKKLEEHVKSIIQEKTSRAVKFSY